MAARVVEGAAVTMRDYDYGRCISACQEKSRMGIDARWCAVCQIDRLQQANAELRQALQAAERPLSIAASYAHAPECTLGIQIHGRDCALVLKQVEAALASPAVPSPEEAIARQCAKCGLPLSLGVMKWQPSDQWLCTACMAYMGNRLRGQP